MSVLRTPNCSKINTFKELMNEITYDWDFNYSLKKDNEGNFYLNKLYIEPNYVTYKTECHELGKGVFEKVEKFYELLQDNN